MPPLMSSTLLELLTAPTPNRLPSRLTTAPLTTLATALVVAEPMVQPPPISSVALVTFIVVYPPTVTEVLDTKLRSPSPPTWYKLPVL